MGKLGPTTKRYRSSGGVATPVEFLRAVKDRFGQIVFDLAASKENCATDSPMMLNGSPRFYSKEDDALTQNWSAKYSGHGLMWLNPPYSDISPWAERCAHFGAIGVRIAFLTPAAVSTNWYADHVRDYAMVFGVRPRLTFVGHNAPYPKDMILSLYGWGMRGFDTWNWRDGTR